MLGLAKAYSTGARPKVSTSGSPSKPSTNTYGSSPKPGVSKPIAPKVSTTGAKSTSSPVGSSGGGGGGGGGGAIGGSSPVSRSTTSSTSSGSRSGSKSRPKPVVTPPVVTPPVITPPTTGYGGGGIVPPVVVPPGQGGPGNITPPVITPPVAIEDLARKYARAVAPRTIYQTSFGRVMPQNVFTRPDLLSQIAFQRVDPEIIRNRLAAQRSQEANMASAGMGRFGQANVARQSLIDEYERQRQERARSIYDTLLNMRIQEYQDLEKAYYQDPNAFDYAALPQAPATTIPTDFVGGPSLGQDLRLLYTPNYYTP